ncbi:hypothetical protein PoB_007157300 [Plakobranchus ocellatus]|uniref:Uncharacterized protein n=1 Tax=Plakobranchus ocellatus TaxID=259542 RepID=A0AAV4DLZ0_9GAST|nr:hypothetical protein PoB_007157300 [Plakobranchus ocellatus]
MGGTLMARVPLEKRAIYTCTKEAALQRHTPLRKKGDLYLYKRGGTPATHTPQEKRAIYTCTKEAALQRHTPLRKKGRSIPVQKGRHSSDTHPSGKKG